MNENYRTTLNKYNINWKRKYFNINILLIKVLENKSENCLKPSWTMQGSAEAKDKVYGLRQQDESRKNIL